MAGNRGARLNHSGRTWPPGSDARPDVSSEIGGTCVPASGPLAGQGKMCS